MQGKVFFISDLHFSHYRSLYHHPQRAELAGISLDEVDEVHKHNVEATHDAWLIRRWNEIVSKHDIVYIIGDFCLGNKERTEYILNKLHGKKYLIIGNHDKSCKGLENYFEWMGSIKEAKFNHDQYSFIQEGETFCVEMCHYPMLAWNRRPHGTCMVHGHTHGAIDAVNKQSLELRVDVGLDGGLANYGFVDLETLYAYFRKIVTDGGCSTFQEYIDRLILKQGYRM